MAARTSSHGVGGGGGGGRGQKKGESRCQGRQGRQGREGGGEGSEGCGAGFRGKPPGGHREARPGAAAAWKGRLGAEVVANEPPPVARAATGR